MHILLEPYSQGSRDQKRTNCGEGGAWDQIKIEQERNVLKSSPREIVSDYSSYTHSWCSKLASEWANYVQTTNRGGTSPIKRSSNSTSTQLETGGFICLLQEPKRIKKQQPSGRENQIVKSQTEVDVRYSCLFE